MTNNNNTKAVLRAVKILESVSELCKQHGEEQLYIEVNETINLLKAQLHNKPIIDNKLMDRALSLLKMISLFIGS